MTLHPLPQTNMVNNTVTLLNKILHEFSLEFVKGMKLIVRMGVTFFPDDLGIINPNKVISNSRYACDEADFQKKEYMFYDEKSHLETRERIDFIKDLIVAVKEEKCKNFLLHQE